MYFKFCRSKKQEQPIRTRYHLSSDILKVMNFILKEKILVWFCLLILAVFSVSCDSDSEQGNVVFYTHIQALLNCGEFGVDIMLDNERMGTLEKPLLPFDSIPDCEIIEDGTVLSLNLPEGEYQIIAVGNCGGNLRDTMIISFKDSECTAIEVFMIDNER